MSVFKKFWAKNEEDEIIRPLSNYPKPSNKQSISMSDDIKCQYGHSVDGVIPGKLELQYDGKLCDCGSIRFYTDMCGCEQNKHLQLYEKEA